MVSVELCYCGERATVSVPGSRCTRRLCADCHRREQDGPRLHAERRARADRETRERIAARPWCSDCGSQPQQYYLRQRLGRRLPPSEGLCWFCVDKLAPGSDDERVDRKIAVLRLVAAEMRSRKYGTSARSPGASVGARHGSLTWFAWADAPFLDPAV